MNEVTPSHHVVIEVVHLAPLSVGTGQVEEGETGTSRSVCPGD